MSTQRKSVAIRARSARPVPSTSIARSVVLDSVGFVKHRSGKGILRLKLIGPIETLQRLRIEEGERLAIARHHLIGEKAAA